MSSTSSEFPEGFFWGASTSSHQVEGGTYNQWTVWELENAGRLAKEAPTQLNWLPVWKSIEAKVSDPNNYVSGEGVQHFTRYKEDFDIAKGLGLNAFRFSIEWSRIEPEEGKWDQAAIDHYRNYIRELKKRGLEPFLNLWHWTNPVWFEEKGGFLKHGNIGYFLRFAATVMEEFGDELNYVLILNEPNIYAWYAYGEGRWPASKHSIFAFLRVYVNLMSAHRQAYKLLKRIAPNVQYSSAPQLVMNVPKDPNNYWHKFGAWTANIGNNSVWFWATRGRYDFIGFNNYFKNYMKGVGINFDNPKVPLNDMGWYMEPAAVAEVARDLHRKYPDMPLFITENGVADAGDKHRKWWIQETLKAVSTAVKDGVPIKGYFHWSLLDNFEWAEGWWPKFGLVEVDREHGYKRKLRPSAKWFAATIKKLQ